MFFTKDQMGYEHIERAFNLWETNRKEAYENLFEVLNMFKEIKSSKRNEYRYIIGDLNLSIVKLADSYNLVNYPNLNYRVSTKLEDIYDILTDDKYHDKEEYGYKYYRLFYNLNIVNLETATPEMYSEMVKIAYTTSRWNSYDGLHRRTLLETFPDKLVDILIESEYTNIYRLYDSEVERMFKNLHVTGRLTDERIKTLIRKVSLKRGYGDEDVYDIPKLKHYLSRRFGLGVRIFKKYEDVILKTVNKIINSV